MGNIPDKSWTSGAWDLTRTRHAYTYRLHASSTKLELPQLLLEGELTPMFDRFELFLLYDACGTRVQGARPDSLLPCGHRFTASRIQWVHDSRAFRLNVIESWLTPLNVLEAHLETLELEALLSTAIQDSKQVWARHG